MKLPTFVLTLLAAAPPLAGQAAPRVTTALPPGELTALEALRRDVWVHWFRGDTAALRRVLGPELIAISPDSELWQGLEQTLAGSSAFVANGGHLISVSFTHTSTHRFGETVVMFSRYAVEMDVGGRRTTQRGRATEVFVRTRGQWVHTSWHLDTTPIGAGS